MNNYQLTVLVKNEIEEKARQSLLDSISKSFGKLEKEDLWGVRSLSYPIQHETKAYYAHYEFESEPDTISSLDKTLKLNEDIIRYLLVRNDKSKKVIKPKKVAVAEPEVIVEESTLPEAEETKYVIKKLE